MTGNPLTDPRWASDLADTLERWTGRLRAATTDHAVRLTRGLVFGVLVVIALATATPLAILVFVRLTQVVLSRVTRTDADTTVWLAYLVVGALFMVAGALMLRRRRPSADR